jgi:hypothetical protein
MENKKFLWFGQDFKQLLTLYTGIISFSTLSHVEHVQHIYILGNIYLFYIEDDSNSHKHSFYVRNDVVANVEFAGRPVVQKYPTLLSPGKYK